MFNRSIILHLLNILLILIICVLVSPIFGAETIRGQECSRNRLLVRFEKSDEQSTQKNLNQIRLRYQRKYQIRELKKWQTGVELWSFAQGELQSLIDSLQKSPLVKFAEPDYKIKGDVISDDPYFNQQWALDNYGQTGGIPGADIDISNAWDITTGSGDVLVGIVDSGVDYLHPDLQANLWINTGEIPQNGIDDDENGFVDDYYGYNFLTDQGDPFDDHGHGTHVAGIIGAKGNNSLGISGVNWDVKLLPLKFLDSNNSGPVSAAISAIEYAIDQNVNFINASWGSSGFSQALVDMIGLANDSGILFVASAGNSALDNDLDPHYPSGYDHPNIISVASSDQFDQLSAFSNWGLNTVDIAAPGTEILSTLPNNSYGFMSGTSMATPYVTGVLALIKTRFPELNWSEIKQQLIATVDIDPNFVGMMYSAGRLNAASALKSKLLPKLNSEPENLSFEIQKISMQSESQSLTIQNISESTLQIDSVIVQAGFLLSMTDSWSEKLGAFQIDPGNSQALNVCFKPQWPEEYKKLLIVYYHSDSEIPQKCLVQLLGRGVSGSILSGGAVSGTWQKTQSPIYITDDIFVESDQTLNIEPGVIVQFEGHHSFTIGMNANLNATGTFSDSIVFRPYDIRSGWNGIRFLNSGNDDTLRYCRLIHSHKSGDAEEDQKGGGLYFENTATYIANSSIISNSAIAGGGLYCLDSDIQLIDSEVLSNFSGSGGGGGMSFFDSSPFIRNVVISGNVSSHWFLSSDNGGGINCRGSSPVLINVTLSNNCADKGGGIYISHSSSHPQIANSIIWDNIPHEICFAEDPKSKSVTVAYSNVEGGQDDIETGVVSDIFWLDGNIDADPKFLDAEYNEYLLLLDSPCIDAGIENTCLTYNSSDQLCIPALEFIGSNPDMGAIESDGISRTSLHLENSWNLISWNLINQISDPESFFLDILNDLDVVLGFDEAGLTFDPSVDESFNNLLSLDYLHGFWVKMDGDDHLIISGSPAEFPCGINLNKGWNLISYLPNQSELVTNVFAGIMDNLIVAESFDGTALTYKPELPDEINTLKILLPGYGYWLKLKNDDELVFEESTAGSNMGSSLAQLNEVYFPEQKVSPTSSWINIYASDLNINGQEAEPGTKIYARDQDGILCGEMSVRTAGKLEIMPVYFDDPGTMDIDEGLSDGDSISLFVDNVPVPVKIVCQQSGQIENISDYILNIDSVQTNYIPLKFNLGQSYPNPFNSYCIIPYSIAESGDLILDIYNVLGQKIFTRTMYNLQPGNYQQVWDGDGDSGFQVASGVYFYRIKMKKYSAIRKMIVIK